MKNLLKILFFCIGVLVLSACSTTKSSEIIGDQTYHFALDSYVVHHGDLASIKAQCDYLVAHPDAKVRIAGNTDERGSREYNVALGWRRAQAVANIMQRQGVAPNQIDIISYGEEKPVAFGHDEDSWWQNRRDDLTYEEK
jgi:peptidoglycan-associated lipoprotein